MWHYFTVVPVCKIENIFITYRSFLLSDSGFQREYGLFLSNNLKHCPFLHKSSRDSSVLSLTYSPLDFNIEEHRASFRILFFAVRAVRHGERKRAPREKSDTHTRSNRERLANRSRYECFPMVRAATASPWISPPKESTYARFTARARRSVLMQNPFGNRRREKAPCHCTVAVKR